MKIEKTSVEPLYSDLDMAYPLDDTFFCDVPAISQPVLMNESDRLAAVDSSLSIALALQQAEETHQFSVLESVQSANMRMEELKREQE
ncbi:unnamed protein product [Prunus armeniaca]